MRTIQRDIVGAAIISKDNKVILGQTSEEAIGVYSGNWKVPGGGIEPGETKLEALRREMLEETNIDIAPYEVVEVRTASGNSEKKLKDTGEVVNVDMTLFDYKVTIHDRTANELGAEPTEEFPTLKWFNAESLAAEPLAPPTRDLLKTVGFLH